MTGSQRSFSDLPDWRFEIDEVSAGVFRVKGVEAAGRSVEASGTDPDAVLADCKKAAAEMQGRSRLGPGHD